MHLAGTMQALDLRQLWDAMRGLLSSVSRLDWPSHLVEMLTAPYGELWESCFDTDGALEASTTAFIGCDYPMATQIHAAGRKPGTAHFGCRVAWLRYSEAALLRTI
ncbi:hypothetical protein BSZ21_05685 [Bradyrhizobium canariense]|nr:hypothetical protein BSZ21_05685 [Bradyrhizobium canariense]